MYMMIYDDIWSVLAMREVCRWCGDKFSKEYENNTKGLYLCTNQHAKY